VAVISRIAAIHFDNNVGSFRQWKVTAPVQDTPAGGSITVEATTIFGGLAPPGAANLFTLGYYTDAGVLIKQSSLNPNAATQQDVFAFTDTGLIGGAPRCGTVEIRVRATRTDLGTFDAETDGSPNTPPTGYTTNQLDRGWIRGTTTLVEAVSNVAAGGAKNQPAEYDESLFVRTTLGAVSYVARSLTVQSSAGGLSNLTNSTTAVTRDVSFPAVVDSRFAAAATVVGWTVTPSNATLTGLPFTAFSTGATSTSTNTTTPDSATAPHTATVSGSVLPVLVASPWTGFGNAMSFDGVDRGTANSQGVNCGNSVSGVPGVSGVGAAAAFCLEAKIQPTVVNVLQMIVGRWAEAVAGQQVLIYMESNGTVLITMRDNGGVNRFITSTTVLTAGIKHDVAATYDGTTMRLFVNGVLDGSLAVSGVQAPDSTALFWIGRWNELNPYPFNGIIEEVRWSKTARYTATYTPAVAPFTADANTLGLWHLDSLADANSTPDSSPNNLTGTLRGTVKPAVVSSPWAGFGDAMSFDGVDRDANSSVIEAPSTGLVFLGSQPFTAEAKFRFSSTPTNDSAIICGVWSAVAGQAPFNWLLYLNTASGVAKMNFAVNASGGGPTGILGTTTLVVGADYDVAGTYDGTTLRLFLNGVLDGSLAVTNLVCPYSPPFSIGALAVTGCNDIGLWPYPFHGVIDEVRVSNIVRYPASGYTPATTPFVSDATTRGLWHLSPGVPASSSITDDTITVDPRLTASHHFQVDDEVFAVAKNRPSKSMLSTETGFLAARFVTARTFAGVNGLSVTQTLDPVGPGTTIVGASVSATRDSQAGWTDLLAWTASKPGGNWLKTTDITAPADISADTHLVNGGDTLVLLAPNPNYRVIVGGGPAGGEDNHLVPGSTLLVGVVMVDTSTGKLVTPDASPTPAVFLTRFNQALGRPEYLTAALTWVSAGAGATILAHPLTVSAGDPQTFVKTFAMPSATWTTADLFMVGIAYVNGTPYTSPGNSPVVSAAANLHGGFVLDAVGLALTGGLSFK